MTRYAEGDDRAFADVYAVIVPRLVHFLARRLADRMLVPDLVQETLLRVHRARGSFVRGSTVIPWVLTIARRLLIDAHRRLGREELTDLHRLDRLSGRAPIRDLPNGEEMVVAKETAARLDRAFARVPEPQQAALRLVRGEGLPIAVVAGVLGTTATGIRLRTFRACRALRAELARELDAASPAAQASEASPRLRGRVRPKASRREIKVPREIPSRRAARV